VIEGEGVAISPYIIVVVVAWLSAHVVKFYINYRKDRTHRFSSNLFTSGGMPSSHTTSVVALTTMIYLVDGVNSSIFGLSLLFSLIVMYDATKVRRSSGEQGEAIATIIKKLEIDVKKPRSDKGHTPHEVAAGILLGLVIGLVVFLATS
jgi:uncharacterized protein